MTTCQRYEIFSVRKLLFLSKKRYLFPLAQILLNAVPVFTGFKTHAYENVKHSNVKLINKKEL